MAQKGGTIFFLNQTSSVSSATWHLAVRAINPHTKKAIVDLPREANRSEPFELVKTCVFTTVRNNEKKIKIENIKRDIAGLPCQDHVWYTTEQGWTQLRWWCKNESKQFEF